MTSVSYNNNNNNNCIRLKKTYFKYNTTLYTVVHHIEYITQIEHDSRIKLLNLNASSV